MGYSDLIRSMEEKAGFTETEAEEALDLMVESIAERLDTPDRQDFAEQLPAELQEVALSVETADMEAQTQDIVHEFMEKENIEEEIAEQQVTTAWETLKSFISEGMVQHIKTQLPATVTARL